MAIIATWMLAYCEPGAGALEISVCATVAALLVLILNIVEDVNRRLADHE